MSDDIEYLDITEWLTPEAKAELSRWPGKNVKGELITPYTTDAAITFTIRFVPYISSAADELSGSVSELKNFCEILAGLVDTVRDVSEMYLTFKEARRRHYFKVLARLRKARRARFN